MNNILNQQEFVNIYLNEGIVNVNVFDTENIPEEYSSFDILVCNPAIVYMMKKLHDILVIPSNITVQQLNRRIKSRLNKCGQTNSLKVKLTLKQKKIMIYLLSGKSVSQCAVECNLSYKSVSYYKRLVMKRLGIPNAGILLTYSRDILNYLH